MRQEQRLKRMGFLTVLRKLKQWFDVKRAQRHNSANGVGAPMSLPAMLCRPSEPLAATASRSSLERASSSRPLEELPPGFTSDALRKLEKQLLFVVGCARSGTTALTRALNRSPDLLLLEEPNFFINHEIREFGEFFNRMHRGMGNSRMKGTYVRPAVEPEYGPISLLARLAQEYRYVGGKVAFGPYDPAYNWPEAFLTYHAKYFFHARRLLIIRNPAESIWSMHKMFRDRPLPLLFSTWLHSVATCIECYRVFPDVRWMFFEDLSAEAIVAFALTIQLEIDVPPAMLARTYVQSKLQGGELPPPLAPYADWCSDCAEIYRALRDNFCRERLRFCGQRSEWDFFDDQLRRIAATLTEIKGDG